MNATMADWALTFKNLCFPIFCKQCHVRLLTEDNRFFCPTCWEGSPRIERPFCPSCGRPHPAGIGLGLRSNFFCGPCSTRGKQPIRRVLAPARYDQAIELAIKLLKFYDKPLLAVPLGELMRSCSEQELDCAEYDFVIPVPLHRVRYRARGFNQAELLAKELLPAFPNARLDTSLARIRPTHVQSRLNTDTERRSSVKRAFAIASAPHLAGSRVLLVDDVVTTGATVSECAVALKNTGVATVDVLAAALALPRALEDRKDTED